MKMIFKNLSQKLKILSKKEIHFPNPKIVKMISLGVCSSLLVYGIVETIFKYKKVDLSKQAEKPTKEDTVFDESPEKLSLEIILKRDLFNKDDLEGNDENYANKICPPKTEKSSLHYKVTGILFVQGSKNSSLVLLSPDRVGAETSSIYKAGDKLEDSIVENIEKDRVYFVRKRCEEYLDLIYPDIYSKQKKTGTPSGSIYTEPGFERKGTNTVATREWVNNEITNDLSKILEDARAIPNVVNGQIKGFAVTQIVPDSVYSKLGLKSGDIISSINGMELNDAARAIQTLNSMKNENKLELRIQRGGESVSLKVNIQ